MPPRRMLSGLAVSALTVGLVLPALPASAATGYVADPAALVDPIIGTSGAVDDFPGADVPFGMLQWSPDTPSRPAGGGYEYTDKAVTGFSLTHISGPGCAASGDIPVLPTSGAIGTDPDAATLPLDHGQETAKAGSYSLTAGGITSSLAATTHTGAARFTFPKGSDANLLLKLSDSAAGSSGTRFQVINNREIQGSVTSGNFCGATDKYTLYFDMVFDRPVSSYGTWTNKSVSANTATADKNDTVLPDSARPGTPQQRSSNGQARTTPHVHGTPSVTPRAATPVVDSDGAYVSFDTTGTQTVQANVGISYVSTANAKKNRTVENNSFDPDTVAANAYAAWKTQLSKIRVGGGSSTSQKVFYTALYHALLHPNVFDDVNGQYAGFDGAVHRVKSGHHEYANYSGWDIYRSQSQLMAMVAPQAASDSVTSMLNQYDQTGQLPKWALNNGESYVMVGDPADAIIADTYAFGARDFDTAKALSAMRTEATQPNNVRPALTQYLDRGYIPMDGDYGCCNFYGPVSTQQEYNTADHAIASFATALGDDDTASTYARRANNWVNVFNPGTNYLEPKYANGAFQAGFTPTSSQGFVEGTSAQYTPMEPFDVAGLIAAAGGRKNWIAKLDALGSKIKNPTAANADFGNEPSIEIPWEYDYAGAPYKTQKAVRDIQQQIYTAAPAGIAGNDDLGTMSAWYVFSALGFYPETPGTADLALGSPVFPKAQVTLATGKTLTVTAPAAAVNAPYVQSMTVDGASWAHAYLPPTTVTDGATVNVSLGSSPNTSWASAAGDAPPSDTRGLLPALGYASSDRVIAAPGTDASVRIAARNLTAAAQTVSWTASSTDDGVTAGPASGSLVLRKNGDGSQQVDVSTPKTEGRYTITFHLRAGDGTALPDVVVEIDVATPGELWPYYNNAGVASDGQSGSASFDGDGWSYSAQALKAAGVTPGGTVQADGLSYVFPDQQPGELDNIEAGGQTIPLAAGTTGATLGLLGSATNADPGAQGSVVVTYTDGTSQTVTLGLTDWTLGGGQYDKPAYGNTIAASTAYRDTTSGGRDTVNAYLFSATAPITAGKTVASVTLPTDVGDGQLHVFAIAAH